MINIIKNLSPRTEFLLVVLGAFGYMMLGSVLSAFNPSPESAIANDGLRALITFELIVFLVLATFLYVRGWRLSRFGGQFALIDVGVGVVLAFVAYAFFLLVAFLAAAIDPSLGEALQSPEFVSADLDAATVIAVSTINPIFEESILCGYVVTVLKERRSLSTALNVSLAIRLACHLYQGPVGVISILPLGITFTYWFARTGRLWPVVIAHALFDLTGLWPYVST